MHRAKHRADASQASKRSPIGDSPWHERCNARSAKTEIAESEYCSRFPLVLSCATGIVHFLNQFAVGLRFLVVRVHIFSLGSITSSIGLR